MESFEPKKLALIRILQLLQKHSDSEHPIKHDKIVELLESVKDKESADAAADELFFIIGRVHELRPDYKKIEHCDADTRNRLIKKLLQESTAIGARKKAVAKSLMEQDFYGSEDLKEALRQMM